MKISVRGVSVAVLAVLVAVYHVLPMAHFFAPLEIFGKNVYTVAPVILMAVVLMMLWRGIKNDVTQSEATALIIVMLLWLVTWFARRALFGEIGDVLNQRFVVDLFLYSIVMRYAMKEIKTRDLLATLMIVVTISQAIAGILHSHFFPFIQLMPDADDVLHLAFDAEGTREAGTIVSSSTFAAVLVCGQFVMLTEKRLSFLVRLMLMALTTYAVSLSGSRFPMVVSALLCLAATMNWKSSRHAPFILVAIALAGIAVALSGWSPFEAKSILRFGQDDGGRSDKFQLAIDLMTTHWSYLLMGAPNKMVEVATTRDGLPISDNSYMLLALSFGVPMLVTWLVCAVKFLFRWPVTIIYLAMLAYFATTLAVTNSLLWEAWLFYFATTMWLVKYRSVSRNVPSVSVVTTT